MTKASNHGRTLWLPLVAAWLGCAPALAFDCPISQMVSIRSSVPNVPVGSIPTSFAYKGPYGPSTTTWGFPVTVPPGTVLLITDIYFQDKKLVDAPNTQAGYRPNYAVLFGIDTLTSVIPSRHYLTPIKMPAGSIIDGVFINHSSEQQNMLIGVNGCLIPLVEGTAPAKHAGNLIDTEDAGTDPTLMLSGSGAGLNVTHQARLRRPYVAHGSTLAQAGVLDRSRRPTRSCRSTPRAWRTSKATRRWRTSTACAPSSRPTSRPTSATATS